MEKLSFRPFFACHAALVEAHGDDTLNSLQACGCRSGRTRSNHTSITTVLKWANTNAFSALYEAHYASRRTPQSTLVFKFA